MVLKMSRKIKLVPRCHGNQPKCPKREKSVFTPVKISQVRELLQNVISDMLLSYNKAMIYVEHIFYSGSQ